MCVCVCVYIYHGCSTGLKSGALAADWLNYFSSPHIAALKLQALVYDILPSTTAVFSYAIGP